MVLELNWLWLEGLSTGSCAAGLHWNGPSSTSQLFQDSCGATRVGRNQDADSQGTGSSGLFRSWWLRVEKAIWALLQAGSSPKHVLVLVRYCSQS